MSDGTKDALLWAWGSLRADARQNPALAAAMLQALDDAERHGLPVPAFLREI